MSIEIGVVFGLNPLCRETSEKWHDDCVVVKNKTRGSSYVLWNGDVGMDVALFGLSSRDFREEAACNSGDCQAE